MKASLCAQMLVMAMVVMATPVLAQTASGSAAPTSSPITGSPLPAAGGPGQTGEAGGPPVPRGGRSGPREACMADAQTVCKGIEPGQGRIIQCLKTHESELSAGCKTALAKAPPHHPHDGPPGGSPPQGGRAPASVEDTEAPNK